MPWVLPVLAAAVALFADVTCRRLRLTLLVATTASVIAFGAAGVASTRLGAGDSRRARAAVLLGAALFSAADFAWLVHLPGVRAGDAGVAALLDFAFAGLSGILGVAREARRAQKR